jgi:biotin transport system substrate-specific component
MMSTRDLVLSALFAAIIVALGILPPITLGFIPVPITAQSLGVMMAGVVLGARRGAIAVLIVLVLVAIGLPVLSGGRGGLAAFAGPTAGFLVGWLFAAFVTGYMSERLVKAEQSALVQTVGFFLAAMIGGIVVLYACGIAYLSLAAKIGFDQAFIGSMAFIPGDIIKAFVAALVGRAVMAGYPLLPVKA